MSTLEGTWWQKVKVCKGTLLKNNSSIMLHDPTNMRLQALPSKVNPTSSTISIGTCMTLFSMLNGILAARTQESSTTSLPEKWSTRSGSRSLGFVGLVSPRQPFIYIGIIYIGIASFHLFCCRYIYHEHPWTIVITYSQTNLPSFNQPSTTTSHQSISSSTPERTMLKSNLGRAMTYTDLHGNSSATHSGG